MLISEYSAKDYPTFHGDAFAEEVLESIQGFDFSHVFVENQDDYMGSLCKEILWENKREKLRDLMPYAERFAILENQFLLDSVKVFYTHNANVIPVLNKNHQYRGYLSAEDVFQALSKYSLFSGSGTVLTLSVPTKAYSMAEVAQIVEGNHGKVYGCLIQQTEETVQMTLKISDEHLGSIAETFERYGYQVVHKFYQDEREELIKDRYQYFQKYLEF